MPPPGDAFSTGATAASYPQMQPRAPRIAPMRRASRMQFVLDAHRTARRHRHHVRSCALAVSIAASSTSPSMYGDGAPGQEGPVGAPDLDPLDGRRAHRAGGRLACVSALVHSTASSSRAIDGLHISAPLGVTSWRPRAAAGRGRAALEPAARFRATARGQRRDGVGPVRAVPGGRRARRAAYGEPIACNACRRQRIPSDRCSSRS